MRRIGFRGSSVLVVLIILAATGLRVYRPGLPIILRDEVNLLYWTDRIVEHGEWIWVSNNAISWQSNPTPIVNHSPLNNYLLIPAVVVSDDPAFVRFVLAILASISVALYWFVVRRYVGQTAALISTALLAVSPLAVEWARFAWNTSIAPLFVVLWIACSLYGYVDRKGWAVAFSWIFLIVTFQTHPAYILLAVPAAVLAATSFATERDFRSQFLRYTHLGIIVGGLTLLPWMYGSFVDTGAPIQFSLPLNNVDQVPTAESLAAWLDQWTRLSAATSYQTIVRASQAISPLNWWPGIEWDGILGVFGYLLLASAVYSAAKAIRRPARQRIALFWALIALVPIVASNLLTTSDVPDWYLFASLPGIFACAGIAATDITLRWPKAKLPVFAAVAAFVVLQFWMTASMLRSYDVDGWQQRLRAPIETLRTLVQDWAEPTGDVVFVFDATDEKYSVFDAQRYFWSVIGDGFPLRVVDRYAAPEGIPLAPQGTTLVSLAEGNTIESLFGPVVGEGATEDGFDPVFERRTVYPADLPAPNFVPEGLSLFSNGAQIQGASLQVASNGDAWTGLLRWTPTKQAPEEQYQFSLRVVDAQGNKHGQQDFTSLRPEIWRAGDSVISPFNIPLAQEAVGRDDLRLQILMYSLPDVRNAQVVDEDGNSVGEWIYLVPAAEGSASSAE